MGTIACGQLDTRDIAESDKIVYGNRAYIKADVEEKIYIYNGVPYCVVKIGTPVYNTPCREFAGISSSLGMADMALVNGGEDVPPETIDPTDGSDHVSETFPANTDTNKLTKAQQSVDIGAINSMNYMPAAVMPAVAAIPMRSNIRTYGPYASSNFGSSTGGINVETNTDICPWVFGSVAGMHGAAISMVENASVGLNRAETGSITIPGFPEFDKIGIELGANGPSLTDLNFSYGSSGVTTTYKFQTFTAKPGTINTHTTDRLKQIAKNRTEQLRFLRNQSIGLNQIGRKIIQTNGKPGTAIQNTSKGPRTRNSLMRVMVGEMYDWNVLNDGSDLNRTVVGLADMSKTVSEMVNSYSTKAYNSFDFFFGPVSKNGDGGLPRFGQYSMPTEAASSGISTSGTSIGAHPPVSDWYDPENVSLDELVMDQYNLSINRQFLDPLITPLTPHHHGPSDLTITGHPYDIIGRGSGLPPRGLLSMAYAMDEQAKYSGNTVDGETDYRFHALRGPIVLQQWGYDTDGKPIPNESDTDTEAKKGNFKRESLKDKFLTNWISKPATWPVGPIDLRYDRNRGVWTAPPPYRIIAAELMEDLMPGASAAAKVLKEYDQDLYDNTGKPIANPTIRIRDRIDTFLSKGAKVYCYFDTYLAEYIAFTSVDNYPTIITGKAATTFAPSDKSATIVLIANAKLGSNNVDPDFLGYPSSPIVGELSIKAYNVKRCGALVGDCVTIHRVSAQGFDLQSATGESDASYVYIIDHTGDNYNNSPTINQ